MDGEVLLEPQHQYVGGQDQVQDPRYPFSEKIVNVIATFDCPPLHGILAKNRYGS